jgi:hypothetical protein
MQLSQKISSLKEKKIALLKNLRNSNSVLRKIKTRSALLSTNLETKHFKNFLNKKLATALTLKSFLGCKGLKANKITSDIKQKYTKKIINNHGNLPNVVVPGVKAVEIPSSFTVKEPTLKEYIKKFSARKNLNIKAILYSYVVDSNQEIWYGHVYVLTKKGVLRSAKKIEQRLKSKTNNTNNIPASVDANALPSINNQ